MPRNCSVPGCKSNYSFKGEYVSTFSFPKDPEKRIKWLKSIHREDGFKITDNSSVCIRHFSTSHIITEKLFPTPDGTLILPLKRPKLTEDAFPTIFENQPSFMTTALPLKRKDPEQRRTEQFVHNENVFDEWNDQDSIKSFPEFCELFKNKVESDFEVYEGLDPSHSSTKAETEDYALNDVEVKIENSEECVSSVCSSNHQLSIQQPANVWNEQAGTSQINSRFTGNNTPSSDIHPIIKQELIKLEDFDSSESNMCKYDMERNNFCIESKEIEIDCNGYSTDLNTEFTGNNTPSSDIHPIIKQELIKLEDFDSSESNMCKYDMERNNFCIESKEIEIDCNGYSTDLNTEDNFVKVHVFTTEETKIDLYPSHVETNESETHPENFEIGEFNFKIDEEQKNFKKHHCQFCDYKTLLEHTLKNHIDKVHKKIMKFNCNLCEYKTAYSFCLKKHVEGVHDNLKKFKCDLCDYTTSYSYCVKKHIDAVHNKMKKFNCHMCDYKTGTKSHLQTHIDGIHENEKKFNCDWCDFKTNLKCNLKTHVDLVHNNKRKFSCHLCDYKASLECHLKCHIEAKHENLKKFVCDLCEYKTAYSSCLKKHVVAVHNNIKNHNCHLCDYKTALKSNLQRHIDGHENVKKFMCDLCEFKTLHKSSLNKHVNGVHNNIKNFDCHLCDYKSRTKSHLQSHIDEVHENLKKFSCHFCDFRTARKCGLKNHISAVHSSSK